MNDDKYADCVNCHGSFRLNSKGYPYTPTDYGMQPAKTKDCPQCGSERGWHGIDAPPLESGRVVTPPPISKK